jgi:hypothetical protein
MELIISPRKMQSLIQTAIDNANNKNYLFISNKRDKEIVEALAVMESMNVRKIEVDLSEDDQSLLS